MSTVTQKRGFAPLTKKYSFFRCNFCPEIVTFWLKFRPNFIILINCFRCKGYFNINFPKEHNFFSRSRSIPYIYSIRSQTRFARGFTQSSQKALNKYMSLLLSSKIVFFMYLLPFQFYLKIYIYLLFQS